MKSIEIFLSSRNNYKMLPIFLENVDLEGFKLSNIDDHSSAKEIALGKDICKKNQIPFIHNIDRGLQWAWKTFIETVPEETKFIVWCTHDAYPLSNEFFTKLNEIVEKGWGLNPNKRYRANFNVDTIYVRPIGITNTYFFEINRTSGDIVIKETNRPAKEGTKSGTCAPHDEEEFLSAYKEQQEEFSQFKSSFLEQRAF